MLLLPCSITPPMHPELPAAALHQGALGEVLTRLPMANQPLVNEMITNQLAPLRRLCLPASGWDEASSGSLL